MMLNLCFRIVQTICKCTNGLSFKSDCEPNDYMHTLSPEQSTWYFVVPTMNQVTGFEDKYETIVHETHASARTKDLGCGRTTCKDLAISDPAKAVNNAENYAFFTDKL